MKKVILLVFALSLFSNVNAQKKSKFEVNLTKTVKVIADDMGLKKDKSTFLYNTLLEERNSRMAQNKGKDLSKEEKKVIAQAVKKEARKKLKKQFSNEEIKTIYASIREQNKNSKK